MEGLRQQQVFEDIIHLLKSVEWLYDFPMTQVFTRNVMIHVPGDWRAAFTDMPLDALNGLPQCLAEEHWPASLKKYLEECSRLSCLSEDLGPQSHASNVSACSSNSSSSRTNLHIPQELNVGLTLKKKHEITTLLGVVKKILDLTESRHVLDVGSGKGYIDSCIHRILQAQVCGIEGNKTLMRSAERHHWKLYGRCRGLTYLNWHLLDNVETICRVGQLTSYLSELSATCTCQIKAQGKRHKAKSANMSESVDVREGVECGDVYAGGEKDIEDRISLCSQSESNNPSAFERKESNNPCTLLGLHACADLSPILIKVFKDCSHASALVLLSCCYHKMSVQEKPRDIAIRENQKVIDKANDDVVEEEEEEEEEDDDKKEKAEYLDHKTRVIYEDQEQAQDGTEDTEEEKECECCIEENAAHSIGGFVLERNDFVNFPMSQCLKGIFKENSFHISVFGLRLGAQESGQKWKTETFEDHEYRMRNVAYRGVLEAACVEEKLTLEKLRRRCARKSSFQNFSEYKKDILENYEFHPISLNSKGSKSSGFIPCQDRDHDRDVLRRETVHSQISARLDSCYERYKHHFPMIEPLTGLQLALQPVIEMMVQMDRLVFLKECGFSRVWLEKVFDPEVSPRNIALMALK